MPTIEARLRIHPRRALDLLREDRRLRAAARAMPKPATWEWARPRLLPLLAGTALERDLVAVKGEPGCAVIFGIECKRTYLIVDRPVAERWETSDEQLVAAARANLERRAAQIEPSAVRSATLSGHIVRILDAVRWSSSLLLSPLNVRRLFGGEDQIFATPRRNTLLSFDMDTAPAVAAHVAIDIEVNAAFPLLLDPFLLEDGEVTWRDLADEDWPDAD
jgi:hypothetical protein